MGPNILSFFQYVIFFQPIINSKNKNLANLFIQNMEIYRNVAVHKRL